MNLKELSDLINVRNYVYQTANNPSSSVDRQTINQMGTMLINLDKKIISLIQTDDFKSYVESNVPKELEKPSNIKSGLHK